MSATGILHWMASRKPTKEDPEGLGVLIGILESVGVNEITLNRLVDPQYWGPDEVVEMQTALSEIIFAGARLAHYEEIDIPVEYTAAVIAEFVHPNNWMVACHLFKRTYTRSELKGSDDRVSLIDPVSATVLFAYVTEWMNGDRIMLRERIDKCLEFRNKQKQI